MFSRWHVSNFKIAYAKVASWEARFWNSDRTGWFDRDSVGKASPVWSKTRDCLKPENSAQKRKNRWPGSALKTGFTKIHKLKENLLFAVCFS